MVPNNFFCVRTQPDRLCGLMVRIPGHRSEFDSWHYHIFCEVMGVEWDSLSLVCTIESLLERESSGSGQENREYGFRDPSR
jgi:hypothetical protein